MTLHISLIFALQVWICKHLLCNILRFDFSWYLYILTDSYITVLPLYNVSHVVTVFAIPVLTDMAFKLLSAGWHLIWRFGICISHRGIVVSLSVCSVCAGLLLHCRSAKSTANVSVSPSAVARCHQKAPTAQPRPPRLDPRPATHLQHRCVDDPGNSINWRLGFRNTMRENVLM